MDQLGLEVVVDFLAQVVYVHVDHVGKAIVIEAPHMLSDHRAAENLVAPAQKKLEQCEFLGGQIDPLVAAANLTGHRIEPKIRDGRYGRVKRWPAQDTR